MVITKEKVLAGIALAVTAFTLASARVPAIEPVPEVPGEEQARAFRAVTSAPRLAPEEGSEFARDPFATKDPWQPATPALLAVPPAQPWPRALPGGPAALPLSPRDRLLVRKDPAPPGAGAGSGGGGR
ncbi:MAG: hypothetical protein AB7N76_07095 [Planctomycetota bacterium]